jgi:pSer/pThr/pTyr-binding forkhead associated (FHA) protein
VSDLTFHVVRLGLLVLLWVFVLAAVRAIRVDVFGPRVPRAGRAQPAPVSAPRRPPRQRAQPKQPKPPRQLVVVEGALAGSRVDLGDAPLTIGRAPDSTIVITDDYASNHHARLFPRDGQWLVEDLGSTNGTYVEHTKISDPTPVPVGAKVRVGTTVLELRR